MGRRDAALFWIGVLGLVVTAVILMGRAPHVSIMRGGGPLSLGLLAAAAAAFVVPAWCARRWVARRAVWAMLAGGGVLAVLAAAVVVLRHLAAGLEEFRLRAGELDAVNALLVVALLLFATLRVWQGIQDAATAARADGARGPAVAQALLRRGAARYLVPLRGPAANLALGLTATLVALVGLEATVRVMEGGRLFSFENLVTRKTDLLTHQGANRYDPLLGWVLADNLKDGAAGDFSTGEHGVRMNGRAIVAVPRHGILVTGDSFTAGSEVRNFETWPAQLEAMTGEPVVNAATGGWGTDQIVLRAESLIPVLQPKSIVVSFLADDIMRAEYETFGGGNKPYFTVEDGALVAHNDPVPRFAGQSREIGWLRHLFGFSHLVAYVMEATGYSEWWFGSVYRRVQTDIVAVTCRLLERLKAKSDAAQIPLYLVLQYGANLVVPLEEAPGYVQRVLVCARQADIPTVDTWAALHAIRQRDALETVYNRDPATKQWGHMSPDGNAMVARMIIDAFRAAETHATR
jgi:hypothetical protein